MSEHEHTAGEFPIVEIEVRCDSDGREYITATRRYADGCILDQRVLTVEEWRELQAHAIMLGAWAANGFPTDAKVTMDIPLYVREAQNNEPTGR